MKTARIIKNLVLITFGVGLLLMEYIAYSAAKPHVSDMTNAYITASILIPLGLYLCFKGIKDLFSKE